MSTKLREIKFKPIKDKTEPQHVHSYTIHILSSISSMNKAKILKTEISDSKKVLYKPPLLEIALN